MKVFFAIIAAFLALTIIQHQLTINNEESSEDMNSFIELLSAIESDIVEETTEEILEEPSEETSQPYSYECIGYGEVIKVKIYGGTYINVLIYNHTKDNFNQTDGALFFEDLFGLCYNKPYDGIPLAAMFAQAYTEGGAGKSGVYCMSNNLFGLKAAANWPGMVYARDLKKTFINYQTAIKAGAKNLFRAYTSMSESIDDYIQLIKTSNLYKGALGKSNKRYLQHLVKHGYGSEYMVDVWMNIISLYHLKYRAQY